MLLEHFQKLYAEFRQRKLRVDAANLFKLTSVIIQVTTPSRTPHRTHHRAALPQPRRTAAARHCPSAATGPRFVCPLVFCLAGLTLPSPPPSLAWPCRRFCSLRPRSLVRAATPRPCAPSRTQAPSPRPTWPRTACSRRPSAPSPRALPAVHVRAALALSCRVRRADRRACAFRPAPRSLRTPRATPFAEQRRGPPCCPHPALCATRSCR